MKNVRIGINGFGRIGRAVARIALSSENVELKVINTRKTPNELLAYMLQYDSLYGTLGKKVEATEDGISVNGIRIKTVQSATPENIAWGEEVDVVIEATGAFTKKEDLAKHLRGSVKRVILTAPAKDETPTIVLGVNDTEDMLQEPILSNASCTTNCAAPLFKVLHDSFGIVSGQMTTVHAYTMTQSMLDDANKEMERSRSAPLNIVPSSSGAAKAVVKVLPELTGKIEVFAVRVPVPVGSASDLSVVVSRNVTVEEVNAAYQKAAQESMQGVLAIAENLLVSSDIVGRSASCTFDPRYTKVTAGNHVKVFGWYDNEWGYSSRVVDLAKKVAQFI